MYHCYLLHFPLSTALLGAKIAFLRLWFDSGHQKSSEVFLPTGQTVKGCRGARKHGVEASVDRIKHTLYSLSGECTAATRRAGRGASVACNGSAKQVGAVKHSNVGPRGRGAAPASAHVCGLPGADRHPLTFTGTRHILYTAVLPNTHFHVSERGGKELDVF